MPDDKMLSQEEIDALLGQQLNKEEPEKEERDSEAVAAGDNKQVEPPENGTGEASQPVTESEVQEVESRYLSEEEKDALGEIGNISMGSASTTLSELLGQRVTITSPKVRILTQEELFKTFQVPYMIIQVEFKKGLAGFNILVIQLRDAMVMADLMMGGDGTVTAEEISEMEISAASEAMNQMIGTASTSLSTIFNRTINISPPKTEILETPDLESFRLPLEDPVVVISFRMTIGELLDTEIMQILSTETAKEVASLLWQGIYETGEESTPAGEQARVIPDAAEETLSAKQSPDQVSPAQQPEPEISFTDSAEQYPELDIDRERLAMLMDIPLRVTVVLGRAKKPIKEVLGYTPGAILELSAQVDDPVEILVNGVLVARGEVVVVNENFGVRITDIITPAERMEKLIE